MPTLENPTAGRGPVVLDIGGDIGALVVTMPAEMEDVEVEIVPTGTDSRTDVAPGGGRLDRVPQDPDHGPWPRDRGRDLSNDQSHDHGHEDPGHHHGHESPGHHHGHESPGHHHGHEDPGHNHGHPARDDQSRAENPGPLHLDSHAKAAPPHVAVVARTAPDGSTIYSLVFGELRAGTYDLYVRPYGAVRLTATVSGGRVTETSWPELEFAL